MSATTLQDRLMIGETLTLRLANGIECYAKLEGEKIVMMPTDDGFWEAACFYDSPYLMDSFLSGATEAVAR